MRLFTVVLLAAVFAYVATSSDTRAKRDNCNSGGCNSGGCNSGSCNNVCSGSTCCTSSTCNTCATTCQSNCQTSCCRDNCVNYCANSCSSGSCAQSTPPCVNNCCSSCSSSSCLNTCTQTCNQTITPTTTTVPVPTIVILPTQTAPIVERPVVINNTNVYQSNHTSHIHINNVINNTNHISVPVYVNTTNLNNIEVVQPQTPVMPQPPIIYPPPPNTEIIKIIERQNVTNTEVITEKPQQERCCLVIHPPNCYTLPDGQSKCVVMRHRECSPMCTSPVVVISGPNRIYNYPQPPLVYQPPRYVFVPPRSTCQRVQQYPWTYCGNYQVQNCGQCYECGGVYNPRGCSQLSSCSQQCRSSMFSCGNNNIQSYCV